MENTIMPLNQVIKSRLEKQKELSRLERDFEEKKKTLNAEICKLIGLEKMADDGKDVEKVQIARSILYHSGDVLISISGRTLVNAAISDIVNDCALMKNRYFGNKRYEGFYQQSDHTYYMGPSHGSVVDELGLKKDFRGVKLTDEQKDACIYYLKYLQSNTKS